MEFKTYTKKIKVNGIEVEAKVVVEVHDDDSELLLDQDFESEQQKTEYESKVRSGAIFAAYILVKATSEGLEGSDSLCGCELVSNNMFNSKPFEDRVNSYLTDYGMEANALEELKRSLEGEYARLTKRAELYKAFSKEGK